MDTKVWRRVRTGMIGPMKLFGRVTDESFSRQGQASIFRARKNMQKDDLDRPERA
jgi:hypothetical protein